MRQIIFDTETTGLNPREDRLVSLAAVEIVDGNLTGAFAHYHLNPGMSSSPKALEVHGLDEIHLSRQPKFGDVFPGVWEFCGPSRFIIHNAKFDLGFLSMAMARTCDPTKRFIPVLPEYTCTYEKAVARRGIAKGRNTLDTLAREWGVQNLRELTGKHGALVDCLVLYGVWRSLAGLTPLPLVQSQLDHYLTKGFGIHGSFSRTDSIGAGVPASAQPDTPCVPADVCAVVG